MIGYIGNRPLQIFSSPILLFMCVCIFADQREINRFRCAKLKKWENHRHLGSFAFERKERERITILVSRWKHVRKLRSLCGSLRKTVLASLTVPLPRYTRAELRGTPRCGKILPSSYALCSPLIPATRLNIFRVDSLEYSQNEGDLWSRFITGCFNCTDLREIHKSINLNIT